MGVGHRMGLAQLLWICLGGAFGTGLRVLVAGWALQTFGAAFPYGTLTVNLIGSLLMGVLMQVGLGSVVLSPTLRVALTTGVLGGFTTYSAFGYETMRLIQQGAFGVALVNIATTVSVCLGATFLGSMIGRLLAGT